MKVSTKNPTINDVNIVVGTYIEVLDICLNMQKVLGKELLWEETEILSDALSDMEKLKKKLLKDSVAITDKFIKQSINKKKPC
jgi:hypothetical protein